MIPTGGITSVPGIWAIGPSFVGTYPDVAVKGTLNANTVGGDVYSLSFAAVAPSGLFSPGVTTLSNTATVTGGDVSPTVQSFIAATAPSWVINKTGPSTLLLGADGTYTIRACPSPATSAFPQSF